MPTTEEPLTFPVFRGPRYPFNQPDRDEITSYRLTHRIPLDVPDVPMTSPPPSPKNPCPPPTTDPPITSLTLTAPLAPQRSKISTLAKSVSDSVVKTLRRCNIFRSCFPLNELSNQESDTAKVLYAHWADVPPPSRHWTYEAAERAPRDYTPKCRRRFKGDKTGKPIWELEAEAVAKGRMVG
ncbi:hypothetical protein NX059_006732 [Plenodomus lindquistii]|nr:hypothetical protein NX059_006732 [Plenodomus lindquistii]